MNPHGARRMWWREVVTSYPCPACGAGPGDQCVSTSGHVKWEPHADRSRLAAAHHWQFPEGSDGDGESKR